MIYAYIVIVIHMNSNSNKADDLTLVSDGISKYYGQFS